MNIVLLQLLNYAAVLSGGNKILDSTIGQGIRALLNDALGAGQIIGCIIVVVIFIWVCMKKGQESDEQGRKRYLNWQITLGLIFVFILLAKDIFNLVGSYFGVSLAS